MTKLHVPTPDEMAEVGIEKPKPLLPSAADIPGLNRALRRQMNRSVGHRGSKAKRNNRPRLTEAQIETQRARELEKASVEKVVIAARSIREHSGGSFWLPGPE